MFSDFSELRFSEPGAAPYLLLSLLLFTIGSVGFVIRRNAIVMLMCVELMLNAVNVALVAFGRHLGQVDGQILVFFILVVAAAEVMTGLAILVAIYRRRLRVSADDLSSLSG